MDQCTKERSNCVLALVYTRTDNLWLGRPPRVRRNSVDGPLFALSKNHDKSTENMIRHKSRSPPIYVKVKSSCLL